jgi:hypothetical protein
MKKAITSQLSATNAYDNAVGLAVGLVLRADS